MVNFAAVGQPGRRSRAENDAPRAPPVGDAALEIVAQPGERGKVGRAPRRRVRAATPKPGDAGDVLGTGAKAALLATAMDQPLDQHLGRARDQRADALRAGQLVGRKCVAEIGAQRRHVDRRSCRAAWTASQWSQRAVLPGADRGNLGHGLDHAGLVVGQHQRHHRRLAAFGQQRGQRGQIDPAVTTHRRGHGMATGKQHRFMLDGGDNHPFAPAASECLVVGFGPAGGEDHLLRCGADQSGDAFACVLHAGARGAADAMDRGRVAAVAERRGNGFDDRGPGRRGGIEVEINLSRGQCHYGVRRFPPRGGRRYCAECFFSAATQWPISPESMRLSHMSAMESALRNV